MLPGSLSSADVRQFKTTVLVNGVARPVLGWSVSRDLVGSLPEQVAATGGVSQATGNIQWGSLSPVSDRTVNPWNSSSGWIPTEGDRVQIIVSDGFTDWSRFVGVIDSSSGDESGGLSSKIVDRIDDLSAIVNIPALVNTMPPLDSGDPWRRIGISNLHYLNTAMRKAGFNSTPSVGFGVVLDAPFQGSVWPLIGDIRVSHSLTNVEYPPTGEFAPWGASRSNVYAVYEPFGPRSASEPVQLTLMRTEFHTGVAYLRCAYGASTLELRINATTVQGRVNDTVVASLPFVGNGVVQLLLKGGNLTLKTSGGGAETFSADIGTTAVMGDITVAGDEDARIAGVMVSHPPNTSAEFRELNYTPNGKINTGTMHSGSIALPAVTSTPAHELLNEIGEALLRPFWIDELGVLNCIASDVLFNAPSVQTLTTLDDIRTLSWSRDLLGVRSQIHAKYLWPSVTARRVPSVTVHEGSSSTVLATGDTDEVIIEPGADEDWVLVDDSPLVAGLGDFTDINKGVGSLVGGIYTDGVNEEWASAPTVNKLNTSLTRLGANQWALKSEAKTLASGFQVELRTVSPEYAVGTSLYPYMWGHELPIIRAKAKITWTERELPAITAGAVGPIYEHDFGPWGTGDDPNGTGVVDGISNFIAEKVTKPAAVINSMGVGYDPRRQLSDVITISSPTFFGVQLKCLVVGVSESADKDGYTQELAVRIISVETTFTTYEQFAKAWGPTANYNNFAAAWGATATYNDFNNDPLKGTY